MITSSHVVSHKKIFHLITVNGSGEVITQAQGSYVNYTTAIATCQKSTGWLCSKPRGKVVAKTIPLWSVLKGIPGNINKITKFTGKKLKKVEFAQLEPSKAHQNYKCLCQDTKQWHRYKKPKKLLLGSYLWQLYRRLTVLFLLLAVRVAALHRGPGGQS